MHARAGGVEDGLGVGGLDGGGDVGSAIKYVVRTPTHTPEPPNPAVKPLAASFFISFSW